MQAIILARRPWRENDEQISLFTDELGRVEALARGSKKPTSKNSPSLEPPAVCELTLIPAKENYLLTNCEPIFSLSNLRQDLAGLSAVTVALKLVEKLVEKSTPDLELFLFLKDWLFFLNSNSAVDLIFPAFVLKFVSHLGFSPNLYACAECAKANLSENNLFFSAQSGGLLCPSCAAAPKNLALKPTAVSSAAIKALRFYLAGTWEAISRLKLSSVDLNKTNSLIRNFVEFHTNKKINLGAL